SQENQQPENKENGKDIPSAEQTGPTANRNWDEYAHVLGQISESPSQNCRDIASAPEPAAAACEFHPITPVSAGSNTCCDNRERSFPGAARCGREITALSNDQSAKRDDPMEGSVGSAIGKDRYRHHGGFSCGRIACEFAGSLGAPVRRPVATCRHRPMAEGGRSNR